MQDEGRHSSAAHGAPADEQPGWCTTTTAESRQYISIRYTERLEESGAVRSVGSKGDSYNNAAAESLIGLYKTELIRRRGPWRGLDDGELATPEYVDSFNHRRLHSHCGDVTPVELETNYYRQIADLTEDQPAEPSPH